MKRVNKDKEKQEKSVEVVEKGWPGVIVTDPMGSYTGRTKDRFETPVQDADDL